MSSLHDLLSSNQRIADNTLLLSERVNNLARKLDNLTPKFERLAVDIHDLLAKREIDEARMYAHFERLKSDLAKLDKFLSSIAKDVDDVQRDVRDASTSFKHQKASKDETDGKLGFIPRSLEMFGNMRTATQVLLIIFVVLLLTGGWVGLLVRASIK